MRFITDKLSVPNALSMYVVLLLTTFLVPNQVIDYSYFPFFLILIFYTGVWYIVLKSIYKNSGEDLFLYDIYYVLGLPGIIYLLSFNINVELWHIESLKIVHLFLLGLLIILRITLYKTKHVNMVRVAVVYLLPLGNFIILNQLFTSWYIWNFLSHGYK